MNDKARAAKNAYHRAWAKKNPEKVKAQQERYWERQAEKAQQTAAQPVPAISLPLTGKPCCIIAAG